MPHLVCFAMKSLSNLAILQLLAEAGRGHGRGVGRRIPARAGRRACRASGSCFPASARPGRRCGSALEGGIRQFNVESEPEMRALSEVAAAMGMTAPVTVRVNPDVDAKTHAKIATGKSENKFGIPIARAREVYAEAAALPGLEVVGIDVHIGSQLTDLAPFEAAYRKVAELTELLRADGHDIQRLDLGGGLGIPYARSNAAPPLPLDYGAGDPAHRRAPRLRDRDRAGPADRRATPACWSPR